MPKCENCYHKDICAAFFDGSGMPDCDYFKDKALIVELPCKVGDKLFALDYDDIDEVECCSVEIDEFGMLIHCETAEGDCDTYYLGDFGESIFLNRNKVEKALEERKNEN